MEYFRRLRSFVGQFIIGLAEYAKIALKTAYEQGFQDDFVEIIQGNARKPTKTLADGVTNVFKPTAHLDNQMILPGDFFLHFGGTWRSQNGPGN